MRKLMRQLRAEHSMFYKLFSILEQWDADSQLAETDLETKHLWSEVVEFFIRYLSHNHHMKEEVLVHALVNARPVFQSKLSSIENEHSRLVELFKELRQFSKEEQTTSHLIFANRLSHLINLYYKHMEAEEAIFFPLAESSLCELDWQKIELKLSGMMLEKKEAAAKEKYLKVYQILSEKAD